jgi:hypothetical protein
MPISTYSELQAAVADFLNRDDLTTAIPNFISLAEAALNRRMRAPEMVTRATVTIDAEYENRPSDWLETIRYQVNTNPIAVLEFVTPEEAIIQKTKYSASGQPLFFSTVGTQFQHVPVPDTSYTGELMYYSRIPALSVTNTTNWLLTANPDIYLYATLVQSAPYLKEDERLATWAAILDRLLAEHDVAQERAKTGSSRLVIRTRTFG